MTCKGICGRYRATKPANSARYYSGQKRCQICEIFIKWEGRHCPCCGYRLRTKPRNLLYKTKLRERRSQIIPISQQVRSPTVEVLQFPNYDLSKLKNDCTVAKFERRSSPRLVDSILQSILDNTFYDIVFKVSRLPNNKWEIFDAQHRFEALVLAHEKHGIKTYNLIFLVYPKDDPRVVYRRTNMGKKLQASDHLKALDDGKKPFFNELRDYVSYYKNYEHMGFVDIIYSYNYATNNKSDGSIEFLDKVLQAISQKDIEVTKSFLKAVNTTAGHIADNPIYRASVYRNIYKVTLEKKLSERQIVSLVKFLQGNVAIRELSQGRRSYHYEQVYKIIIDSMRDWS